MDDGQAVASVAVRHLQERDRRAAALARFAVRNFDPRRYHVRRPGKDAKLSVRSPLVTRFGELSACLTDLSKFKSITNMYITVVSNCKEDMAI